VVAIASIYIGIVLNQMGVTKFYLKAHDSISAVVVNDLWAPHPFRKYIITVALCGILALLGLILLIVPGIILGLGLSMSVYLVLDRGMEPVPAMKESWRMTKGNRFKIFLMCLVVIGVNLLGILALVIGLIVSIPVTTLAMVHVYRALSGVTAVAVPAVVVESAPVTPMPAA
jgi:uncharacterized membrane protein